MGKRSAFILVPETLESHGILGTGWSVCRSGISLDRTVPRAPCRVACRVSARTFATGHRHEERAALPRVLPARI
jgi:hypothetical protein